MKYKRFLAVLAVVTICPPLMSCGEDLSVARHKAGQAVAAVPDHMGEASLSGQGDPRDSEAAVEWLRLVAERGLADAQSLLGACYSKGEGVPQDYKEAVEWHRRAAEQGCAVAQYNLGLSYAEGKGVPQDYANAYAWVSLAAAQGEGAAAQARPKILGKMILAQITEGRRLFQKYIRAPLKTGGNVPTEEEAAAWVFTLPPNNQSNGGALITTHPNPLLMSFGQYEPGSAYYTEERAGNRIFTSAPNNQSNGGDLITTQSTPPLMSPGQDELSVLRQKAERGDAAAQYELGSAHYRGQGVPQNYKKAVKWFRLAAEQGDVVAQTALGLSFYHGNGARQDYKEAVKWFRLAAERGNSAAQVYLGDCYYFGKGAEYNSAEANEWYSLAVAQWNESSCLDRAADVKTRLWKYWCKGGGDTAELAVSSWLLPAAKQGFAEAQVYLGDCYASGVGIKRERPDVPTAPNPYEAAKWYRLAAKQGNREAQTKLGNYYSGDRGTPADVDEAVKWYHLAAEQGDMEAQYKLGLCYQFGEGTPKDFIRAGWWKLKAETQNLWKWEGGREKTLLTLFTGFAVFLTSLFVPTQSRRLMAGNRKRFVKAKGPLCLYEN